MTVSCPHCDQSVSSSNLSNHLSAYHSATAAVRFNDQNDNIIEVTVKRTPSNEIHCPCCNKPYLCSLSLQAHFKSSCFGESVTKACPFCGKEFTGLQFFNLHVENQICLQRKKNKEKLVPEKQVKIIVQEAKNVAREAKLRLAFTSNLTSTHSTAVNSATTNSSSTEKTSSARRYNLRLRSDHAENISQKLSKTATRSPINKSKSVKKTNSTRNQKLASTSTSGSQTTRRRRTRKDLPFICPYCTDTFQSRDELDSHMEETCIEPPFGSLSGNEQCLICDRYFDTNAERTLHKYNFHQQGVYVDIPGSEKLYTRRNEYGKFKCPRCELEVEFTGLLKCHLAYHCEQSTVTCDECLNRFENILQLNTHKNQIHCKKDVMVSSPSLPSPTTTTTTALSSSSSSSSSSSLSSPPTPPLTITTATSTAKANKNFGFQCHLCKKALETDIEMKDHFHLNVCQSACPPSPPLRQRKHQKN